MSEHRTERFSQRLEADILSPTPKSVPYASSFPFGANFPRLEACKAF